MVKIVPTVPVGTFRGIARTLLEKTQAGQVNWVRPQPRNTGVDVTYEVVLPHSRIILTYAVPRAEFNYLQFQLVNPDGLVVDTWKLTEPDWGDPENPIPDDEADPEGDWRLLHALFTEVHRRATGWDIVVRDIQQALASPGAIGQPATR